MTTTTKLDTRTLAVLLAWESGVITQDEAIRKLGIKREEITRLEHQGIEMGRRSE